MKKLKRKQRWKSARQMKFLFKRTFRFVEIRESGIHYLKECGMKNLMDQVFCANTIIHLHNKVFLQNQAQLIIVTCPRRKAYKFAASQFPRSLSSHHFSFL